ncbi:Uu.00g106630.m01.CDS01 [Anthostomella pinea]|uniref:Uu.00g106630.m01.CDS01 n=1 Tax=Anthostomella pinea TaxID=933095 RepID=A0AAI8YFX4_9PEZI|nr:Uu.00g106630.m01.CDS01 [Anthostomella pinea]
MKRDRPYDSHWDATWPSHGYSVQAKAYGGTFLSLATCYNVVEYVQAKADPTCLVQAPAGFKGKDRAIDYRPWPLLMDVVMFDLKRTPGQNNQDYGPMIQCLLDKGADVDFPVLMDRLIGPTGDLASEAKTSPLIEWVAQLMMKRNNHLQPS